MQELQKRFNTLFKECKEELKNIIPYSDNIYGEIKIMKSKKSLGRCKRNFVYYTIYLSKYMGGCTDKEIKNTICHELIHTCEKCFNHGEVFKKYASILNDKFNYNIKRTSTCENFKNSYKLDCKYIIKCKNCNHTTYLKRKLKYHIDLYKCTCNGKLEYIKGV